MNTQPFHRNTSKNGYTLISTMLIAVAAAILLAGTLSRTFSGSKLNDRNNAYICGTAAAEAATEKVMAQMMIDFANGGLSLITNNLSYYKTGMLPSSSENGYWTNFVFWDGQGNKNAIYVAQTTTNANPPFVALETQYPGLNAFASTYRILANATLATNSQTFNYYNFTNAVCQDVQMAEIPVFQFAIFYNGLLEFSDCATLTVNGRVYCNTNIDIGTPSSSILTFNYLVNAGGVITNPPNAGLSTGTWSGTTTYNGTPSPGYATGSPVLTLPMGAATNAAQAATNAAQIIQLPNSTDSTTNPISLQRYYYQAYLVILVTNVTTSVTGTTTTNVATSVTFKNSMFDAGTNVSYTNYAASAYTNTNAAVINGLIAMNTNWAWWFGSTNSLSTTGWLTTNATFYDKRQGQTNRVTQIDVGKFGTWIAANTNCLAKWNATTPFNGIIYVADMRTTNGMYMDCVRLTNGQSIPTIGASNCVAPYSTNYAYNLPGLTVGTINPLYIAGLYNCPSNANLNSTNVIGTQPCSVICDALTILSPNWQDGNSWTEASGGSVPSATSDTVDAAIIAGNVPSSGTGASEYSGGVHNLTRLLEQWSGNTLTLNTSIINLYPSLQATVQFQQPSVYYTAPTRQFYFNQNYQYSGRLPPGTPQVNRLIRATWFNPQPNNISQQPSPTLSFVPQ